MKPQIGEIYTHYKNPDKRYRIVGIARDTETEQDMVVYEPLYPGAEMKLFVRPLAMFVETVEYNGANMPRFTRK